MQLDDFNITAEYMEYSDSSNKSLFEKIKDIFK